MVAGKKKEAIGETTGNTHYQSQICMLRNNHLWYITFIMIACSVFYYMDVIIDFARWVNLHWAIFYTVHDLHRSLFLVPVLYAGYVFRLKGIIITTLLVLLICLPRSLFVSPYPDPLFRLLIFIIGIGIVGIILSLLMTSLSARKQTYENITKIAKEWQSTFDSITDLVSIQDSDFKLIRVNKAYADVFHKKPEELAGKQCYEVVHRKSCPIENCPQEKAMETKESTISEIFEPSLGIYLEISCSPIFNEQGQSIGTIHIAKNSTERRQIKEELQNNRDHLNEMGRIAKVGGWEFDVETRVQTWTEEVYTIHELAPDHQPTVEEGVKFYAPEAIPVINNAVERAIEFGESFDLELPFITAKGNNRWVHAVGRAYQKEGKTVKVGGIIQDITEHKQVEKAQRESEQKYKALAESSLTGVFITQDDKFIYVNNEFSRMHGYQPDELLGKEIWLTLPAQEREMVEKRISQRTAGEQVPHIITRKRFKKDGTEFWAEQVMNVFEYKGKTAYMGNILDVTERRQLQQKLEETATHDHLTGLPNRILLLDRFTVAAALARRNKAQLAVMSLDLDNFKSINDTLGHAAGDQVLKVFSARLSGIIRGSDTIARVGGDEFVLVMMETKHRNDATAIAQKIMDSFKEPLSLDGHQIHLSTSIGIAICPEDAEDMETLIKKSDAAMYYSKGHGRNQFKFFSDGDVLFSGDHHSAKI
jgi:diguanylate cyclase (GGDEF)-like protein/PAS domain S-box-containing protein